MNILAIETSCDETSAAIVQGDGMGVKIISSIVSSQINIHKKYGGVVPEVAARNHIKNIIPVVNKAIGKAFYLHSEKKKQKNINYSQIGRKEIGLIAVTSGPGLVSSLLIGAQTADALAYTWKKPFITINHIEGHIYANWLRHSRSIELPKFPSLCLVVSGGHTQLVLMRNHHSYKTIGQTRDDAAGEAFDKVAQILGIGYPGGPIISKLAQSSESEYKEKFHLPRPMMNNNDFDFSFSGLKTAVLYLVNDLKKNISDDFNSLPKSIVAEICKEFQQAVIDVLIAKTIKAAKAFKVKSILLAGGVSANYELRKQLGEKVKTDLSNVSSYIPEQDFCTDNAAMIGAAAYYRIKANPEFLKQRAKIKVDPNWEL